MTKEEEKQKSELLKKIIQTQHLEPEEIKVLSKYIGATEQEIIEILSNYK